VSPSSVCLKPPNVLFDFSVKSGVLASMNHPDIATIYGVEEISGRHFLVMELVSGECQRRESFLSSGFA
jgi:hypothetical protein